MLYLSTGNRKLKSTENVRFLIWNLPSVITCPYSTEMCRKYCYARKAERLYPAVMACRENNLRASQEENFIEDMRNMISAEITKRSYIGKTILFRVHESGDFYSVDYCKKWLEIARLFPAIKFLAYTKSLEFFHNLVLPNNFTLRASIWADTAQDQLIEIDAKNYPTYGAVNKAEFEKIPAKNKCDCGVGCGNCGKCWNKSTVNIITQIH